MKQKNLLLSELSNAVFDMILQPQEYRVIIELNTFQNDNTDPLRNYYMIDGDQKQNGRYFVCGDFAVNHARKNTCRWANIQAVCAWAVQMINRGRVHAVWAETY